MVIPELTREINGLVPYRVIPTLDLIVFHHNKSILFIMCYVPLLDNSLLFTSPKISDSSFSLSISHPQIHSHELLNDQLVLFHLLRVFMEQISIISNWFLDLQ
uniref:Uncharacterized protein n=1 Tax=Cacopsylla melanoneura TaxID=428564 RepID=A0A8D8WRF2_9HEMI